MRYNNINSNEDVVRAFAHGRHGMVNRIASIKIYDGAYVLVGYGHAAYAVRASDGHVTRFNGWYGRSNTTSKHLNLLDPHVNDERNEKPGVPDVVERYVL